MGSFPGHVLPGTLFFVVGIWHIWCSIVRYVSNPKSFQFRVWNPVPSFEGRFKYLELYIIAVGGFIDLCIEFLYSTHLKIFIHGVLNPSHMNNFEHSGMLLMFFIFGVITLLSEKTSCFFILTGLMDSIEATVKVYSFLNLLSGYFFVSYIPLPEGALCFIASAAFTAEYLLFYFHSTTHKGLEGYYHFILVVLIGLCILSTITGTLVPTSFPVDLCSGIAIALQGLWFYQTAFTLYGSMMPEGCHLQESEIICHSTEHEIRGVLLANFQLFVLVFGVLVFVSWACIYNEQRFRHSNLTNAEE